MTVTIKEIARRTGWSIPTVGNILGSAGHRYRAQTRASILKAAHEMGYKPNASARAMRRGLFGCASLVLSRSRRESHSWIPIGLLDSIDDALARHDMHLNIARLFDEELTGSFLPKVLRESMSDGMIINYTHEYPPAMLELIRRNNAPAVWINAKLPANCVYPDDQRAAQNATRQLLELGHRRIAFLHMIDPSQFHLPFDRILAHLHYSAADRVRGYAQAMRAVAQRASVTFFDRYVEKQDQISVCLDLLRSPDRPTAVVVNSERDVAALLCAATGLGLAIPRDLSVVVFYPTDLPVAGIQVSAVRLPFAQVGAGAVEMLLKRIKAPGKNCRALAIDYDAVSGRTMAPPRVAPPRVIAKRATL